MPRTIDQVAADLRRDAEIPDNVALIIDRENDSITMSRGHLGFRFTREILNNDLQVMTARKALPILLAET